MKGRMTMKMKYLAASFATLVIGGLAYPRALGQLVGLDRGFSYHFEMRFHDDTLGSANFAGASVIIMTPRPGN
jgi:hypothetical protein